MKDEAFQFIKSLWNPSSGTGSSQSAAEIHPIKSKIPIPSSESESRGGELIRRTHTRVQKEV